MIHELAKVHGQMSQYVVIGVWTVVAADDMNTYIPGIRQLISTSR